MTLHNVAEMEENPFGVGLYRFPESLRNSLGNIGKVSSSEAADVELRFVSETDRIRITCTNIQPQNTGAYDKGKLYIYKGDFLCSIHTLQCGIFNHIEVISPDSFNYVKQEKLYHGYFSPKVWRFVFVECIPVINSINTFGHSVTKPTREAMPKLRWLAYGSSITHHGSVDGYSYVQYAARRLKVDVLNKGLGGACLCEPQMVDYLVGINDWDFATLELGVNMLNFCTPEVFCERIEYLLERIASIHLKKPILVYYSFTNSNDYMFEDNEISTRQKSFRKILVDIINNSKFDNVLYIDSSEILNDMYGLTTDLLHPCGFGHAQMGENLSKIISRKVLG